MVSNEFYVEKLLYKDAAKIVIDDEFKCDLKNRIMLGEKYNNITELPKRKNNFKQSKYFKVASGFVICVVVSGTIFKAIDIPSNNMFAKGKGSSKVINPISSVNNPVIDNSGKASVAKPKDAVANNSKTPSITKNNKGSVVTNKPEKNNQEKVAVVNKITDKVKSADKAAQVSESLGKGDKTTSVPTDVMASIKVTNAQNIPNIPKMETVKDDVSSNLKLYDSSYSLGDKSLVNVKEGAIYVKDIESSKEKKLIAYDENTQIVEKPNFTPTNEVIYYKAQKVTTENGDIATKNGAIYLADKNGQGSTKLVDGKNPMISKDGKNLVYETDGKIIILDLATNNKKFVDNGKEPAFANNGNTISYVKEEKETQTYDSDTTKKDAYIQKTFSSLWVFDLATENTRSLTNNEVNINSETIQSWAEAVKTGSITSDLKVTSKYSYFESIWSSNNKEIYVIRKNNDSKVFELIKFNLDK